MVSCVTHSKDSSAITDSACDGCRNVPSIMIFLRRLEKFELNHMKMPCNANFNLLLTNSVAHDAFLSVIAAVLLFSQTNT